jgi:hypothetical protein
VPAVIYTIPPGSPLHYVTYAEIYGGTTEVIYEGYTPGYLGTVVAPDGVVVYGTGYDYDPWIGTEWYAPPETWGVMAQPTYSASTGWAYGFALGMTTAALAESYASPVYYTSYYHGYPCCGSASANVYGHWGNTVTQGTRTWYANSSGYGTKASGTYENTRTGTTGSYSANRSYDPYSGKEQASTNRSFETQGGTTGDVSRNARYDYQTGQGSYSSSMSAQGAGGSSVDRDTSYTYSPKDGASAERTTTVDNARTGQTNTYSSGYDGDDRYAGADGNVLQERRQRLAAELRER